MAQRSTDKLKLLQAMLQEKGIQKQEAPTIPRRATSADAPLSYGQQRMWFVQLLEPDSSEYNDTLTVRIEGIVIDPQIFGRCVAEVVRRHQVLRTVFATEGGTPVQRVLASLDVPLRVVDLRERDAAAQAAELEQMWRNEARGPFVLEQPPLLRTTLALLADDICEFGLTMHHIVSDGVAYSIFFREISALYQDFAAGRPPSLPPLAIQFADYAQWERDTVTEEVIQKKLPFWQEYLGGDLPAIQLPTDRPRTGAPGRRGAFVRLQWPAALFAELQSFCQREKVTSNWVLLASYFALWHSFSGQTDLVVGTPSSIRGRRELEELIGFFVQTLILRLDVGGNPTFRELMRRAQRTALEVQQREEVPFDRIFQAVRPGKSAAEAPMIHAWIAPMKNLLAPISLPGARSSYQIVDPKNARFDIALILDETPAGMAGYWEYDVDLFEHATVQRIEQRFQQLLRQVLAHPDTTLGLLVETVRGAAPKPAPRGRKIDLKKVRRRPTSG